ncbi:hypothetical protein OF829_00510 [Sphingomonas sp. LB-2]|uniref:hypothetical protein n=1 Tax=Sphingomonas caeni TaxID=2984949 RepID=UPI00223098B8|nr:hypothetical protein [Sphingomonas caeni]MCW3845702.1 hypothetical protein [Sphingomonas caeni]
MIALTMIALLAAPAPRAPEVSWGKAGISFEQYRRDAVECGRMGANRDVSGTNAARIFRNATQQLDTVSDGGSGVVVNMWETDHLDASGGATGNTRYEEAPTQAVETGQRQSRIVESTRPQKRIGEVRVFMEDAVNQCLAERGYTRFRLTREQRSRLGHLRYGTPERHAYLFSLASDPHVLETQAVA